MKKSLFIAALATLALASCSKNEVIELQQDQIKFSAVADNASRGSVVRTENIGEFAVLGYLSGTSTVYIGDNDGHYDVAKKIDGELFYKTDKNYFWPTQALDVEAFFPVPTSDDEYFIIDLKTKNDPLNNKRSSIAIKQKTNVAEQKDILYAVKKNVTKGSSIPLNFRHALSQIVFSAGVTSGVNLEVKINSISFENNWNTTAYYQLPDKDTDNPDYHTNVGETTTANPTEVNDAWATIGDRDYTGKRTFNGEKITVANELTLRGIKMGVDEAVAGYQEYTSSTNSAMFMIPHKRIIKENNTTVADTDPLYDSEAPFNIVVNCQINSLSADGTSRVRLFPASGDFGDLKQEIAIDWKQGVKYHYKLNFEESVETIKFSITVDEYQTEDKVISVPVG